MYRSALSLLVLAALVVPAHAQNPLELDVDPVSLGWDLIDEGPGTPTVSLAGGILTMDIPSTTVFYGYRAPLADVTAAVASGQWAYEARLRLLDAAVVDDPTRGALLFVAADGSDYFPLAIFEDKIELLAIAGAGPYSGTFSHAMDTTDDFHVYRAEVDGDDVEVFVDGVSVMSAVNNGSVTFTNFAFGDLLYENSSISEWDYVLYEGAAVVDGDATSWSGVKWQFGGSDR